MSLVLSVDRADSAPRARRAAARACRPSSCSRPCGPGVPARYEYHSHPPKDGWQNCGDTHRHTTHHSSMAQIWYLHHPFCGQTGEIVRWLRHQTADSLVVKLSDGLQLAIPSWMLDPLACSQVSDAPEPSVSVDALLGLRDLLDHHPSLRTSEQPPTSCASQPQGVSNAQESSSLSIAPEPTPLCPGPPLATAASPSTPPVSRPHHPIAPQCHPQRAQQGEEP